jgi:hypothetical protein
MAKLPDEKKEKFKKTLTGIYILGALSSMGISVAVVLIAFYMGVKMYASNAAEVKVNEAIAEIAKFADIDYEKVSVDLLGMDVRISDIIVSSADSKEKLKIDEIVIHDIDNKSDIPTFLSMSCNGIAINIKDLGGEAKELRRLGYNDKMMVNLIAEYAYDKKKKGIDIKKIGMGAVEVGEISIGFRLGNISLDPEEITGLFFNYPEIIFHEAKIEYKDDSLVARLIKFGAEEQQVNVKGFKKSLIQDVENEIKKEKDDFTKKTLSEIKEFLEGSDEFSISASPSKPLPLGRIMRINEPKDIIKLLNIQIKS